MGSQGGLERRLLLGKSGRGSTKDCRLVAGSKPSNAKQPYNNDPKKHMNKYQHKSNKRTARQNSKTQGNKAF
eukprot:2164855-Amphidinium_carterae.1